MELSEERSVLSLGDKDRVVKEVGKMTAERAQLVGEASEGRVRATAARMLVHIKMGDLRTRLNQSVEKSTVLAEGKVIMV